MNSTSSKLNIRTASPEVLQQFFQSKGEKPFRAKQIQEWLWKKGVHTFEEMSNLSKELRTSLIEHFDILYVKIDDFQVSSDRTIKNAFRLYDNNIVEGVLIPSEDRMTACVSSQVGCSLTCKFCATGRLDRVRNLNADEIFDQVLLISRQSEKHYNIPLTNIVYMGMGEPLLNYANVLKSIEHITSPEGLNMSPKRITVSTAGIAKMIKKLGDDKVKFNLALSLHAANDEKRNKIMPINESNTLESLSESLKYFYQQTKTHVTFEYIIFKDFNDTLKDAEELKNFTKNIPCKINVIEYNPIDGGEFQNTTEKRTEAFKNYLENHGLIVNVRRSRGKDIDAACGQLANKIKI